MKRNIEIKARVSDLGAIRQRAELLASAPPETLVQTDTFFAIPHGRLKVRQFADGSGELIVYVRPDVEGPKESQYSRVEFLDARSLVEALARVLPVRGIVAKQRQVFIVGRTRVHLDIVENLGQFVELEVVLADDEPAAQGDREARELLRALDIQDEALVSGAYVDLLLALGSEVASVREGNP